MRAEESEDSTDGSEALELLDPASVTAVLRYSELKVLDANGQELPAWLEAGDARLTIIVAMPVPRIP